MSHVAQTTTSTLAAGVVNIDFFLLYSILSPELYYFVQKQQQKPSKADYKYRLSKRNINGLLFRSIQRKPI